MISLLPAPRSPNKRNCRFLAVYKKSDFTSGAYQCTPLAHSTPLCYPVAFACGRTRPWSKQVPTLLSAPGPPSTTKHQLLDHMQEPSSVAMGPGYHFVEWDPGVPALVLVMVSASDES